MSNGEKNITTIRRYILTSGDNVEKQLYSFFGTNRWKKIDSNLFRTRFSSVYFKIINEGSRLYVDFWGEGPFGIIIPTKNRFLGIVDKIGDNMIIKEFENYLSSQKISFYITKSQRHGRTQYQYIFCALVYFAVLLIVLFFVL
jgi:hypothetical protein